MDGTLRGVCYGDGGTFGVGVLDTFAGLRRQYSWADAYFGCITGVSWDL